MCPRAPLARVQPVGNLDFALRILEAAGVVSRVYAVLTEKLIADSLSEENIVLLAERDRAPGPTVRFVIKRVMLIGARHVRIRLRDHGRGERADALAVREGGHQLNDTQQQLDRLFVTAGEVMKARFNRERVGCFEWIR